MKIQKAKGWDADHTYYFMLILSLTDQPARDTTFYAVKRAKTA